MNSDDFYFKKKINYDFKPNELPHLWRIKLKRNINNSAVLKTSIPPTASSD